MKKSEILTLLLTVVTALCMVGCSEESVTETGTLTEEQALKLLVTQVDSVADFLSSDEITIDDDGMQNPEFEGNAGAGMDKLSLAGSDGDSIYPVRWGRKIAWNNINRSYVVIIQGDSIAFVTITKVIPGSFWVGWGTRTQDTVIVQDTVQKSFTETVRRKVAFRRIARFEDPRRNWIPAAITMVKGESDGENRFSIASMEWTNVQNGHDTSFTDPLNSWFRLGRFWGSIPVLSVNDSIRLRITLTSADSSAEMIQLRHGIGAGRMERRRVNMHHELTEGGPGNYTRVYTFGFRVGLYQGAVAARFNLMVDAISHGTVYSTIEPLSNEFWGIPYIVVR